MSDIVANVNQVLYNSPQVSSLVGGQVAAEAEALRQSRAEEARRQEDNLARTVLAMDSAGGIDSEDLADEGRRETRRERLARLKAERELKLKAARAARKARQARAAESAVEGSSTCARSSSPEIVPVVDVCI